MVDKPDCWTLHPWGEGLGRSSDDMPPAIDVLNAAGHEVCTLRADYGTDGEVIRAAAAMMADARLIAAAPELLAALIAMDEEFGTVANCKSQFDACDMAKVAIRKAVGDDQ
jgi:hypothetical protein